MPNRHTVTSHDKWFLEKHMKDPVTQEPFKIGDGVILCEKCKTPHYVVTWGMNPNKCCSVCECNTKLNFNTFSPVIFQQRLIHSSRFNVVITKLPFWEKLRFVNGYPISYVLTAIFPVCIAILLFFSASQQVGSNKTLEHQVNLYQDNIINFSEDFHTKLLLTGNKKNSIEINTIDINTKKNAVIMSFNLLNPKLESTKIADKINHCYTNIRNTFDYAFNKLSLLCITASKFIEELVSGE